MRKSETVLSFGSLKVRSTRAREVRELAKDVVQGSYAFFTFSGFESQTPLTLFDQSYLPERTSDGRLECRLDSAGCVFFDQVTYMFSFTFPEGTQDARIFSPLASWCDAADWDGARLSLSINFGNDLGEFELCWEWIDLDGSRHSQSMRAQVFSSKLSVQTHVNWMIQAVRQRFNWLRIDLLRQTQWAWQRSQDVEASQQSWLLIFQSVRRDMDRGFRRLIKEHRRRLLPHTRYIAAEKIRKMPPRLEERVAQGMLENSGKRYAVEEHRLQSDTPENRYMKHILRRVLGELHLLIERLTPVQRVSEAFKERLREWAIDWEKLTHQHFWQGVGDFHGLQKESLVLSQDPLYASIRRAWYWLKEGLEFLDNELRGGIQNVAQLYEIWCLVQIDRILAQLDWKRAEEPERWPGDSDNWEAEDIRPGALKFSYNRTDGDGRSLHLLFQPTATQKQDSDRGMWPGVLSLPETQRPDIVLRVHEGDTTYTWILDAKYRLHGKDAPADAINSMHAYRDAILWSGAGRRVRESLGAFVLYPGEEPPNERLQYKSIDMVNIGAFPLVPAHPAAEVNMQSSLAVALKEWLKKADAPHEQDARLYHAVPGLKKDVLAHRSK